MQQKWKTSSSLISTILTSNWGSLELSPSWGQASVGALYSVVQSGVCIQDQAFQSHHQASEEMRMSFCVGAYLSLWKVNDCEEGASAQRNSGRMLCRLVGEAYGKAMRHMSRAKLRGWWSFQPAEDIPTWSILKARCFSQHSYAFLISKL